MDLFNNNDELLFLLEYFSDVQGNYSFIKNDILNKFVRYDFDEFFFLWVKQRDGVILYVFFFVFLFGVVGYLMLLLILFYFVKKEFIYVYFLFFLIFDFFVFYVGLFI